MLTFQWIIQYMYHQTRLRALARGRHGRSGHLKCPHFAHLLDQSDIDFAQIFGKLQTLSINE